MLTFLITNLATFVIGLILLSVVVLIIAFMIRNKKKGKSSCGGGCSGCPMAGSCQGKK